MVSDPIYVERVSSNRTEALFVGLAILFFVLSAALAQTDIPGVWWAVTFGLFTVFTFYTLNYRTLVIRLGEEALQLQFGIFQWEIPFKNIIACYEDPASLWRIGGQVSTSPGWAGGTGRCSIFWNIPEWWGC